MLWTEPSILMPSKCSRDALPARCAMQRSCVRDTPVRGGGGATPGPPCHARASVQAARPPLSKCKYFCSAAGIGRSCCTLAKLASLGLPLQNAPMTGHCTSHTGPAAMFKHWQCPWQWCAARDSASCQHTAAAPHPPPQSTRGSACGRAQACASAPLKCDRARRLRPPPQQYRPPHQQPLRYLPGTAWPLCCQRAVAQQQQHRTAPHRASCLPPHPRPTTPPPPPPPAPTCGGTARLPCSRSCCAAGRACGRPGTPRGPGGRP